MEGAFLNPTSLKKLGQVILLTTLDEKLHKKHFLKHREKLLDLRGKEFKAARMNQEFLIEEAKKLKIQIINNDETLNDFDIKITEVQMKQSFLLRNRKSPPR